MNFFVILVEQKGFTYTLQEVKNMITLFDWKSFYDNRATTLLPLQCENCGEVFWVEKRRIQSGMAARGNDKCNYCSKKCSTAARAIKVEMQCGFCNKKFSVRKSLIKPTKTGKHFCSKSCVGKFIHKRETKCIQDTLT